VSILAQGVRAWNRWRRAHPDVIPDLAGVTLRERRLTNCNLARARLSGANLDGSDFHGSDFSLADLSAASAVRTNLRNARLNGAVLDGANLSQSDLTDAHLAMAGYRVTSLRDAKLVRATAFDADFRGADLRGADLSHARIHGVLFIATDLDGCNLTNAQIGSTRFLNVDLSNVIGTDTLVDHAPSNIDLFTLTKSRGRLPIKFLRKCWLDDFAMVAARLFDEALTETASIELMYDLFMARDTKPVRTTGVFISYSHRDSAFVDALENRLRCEGVRCWRDSHEMRAGRMELQIDRAIHLNPIVIVVLSSSSVDSDWVEWEAARARDWEIQIKRDVLCPIALDKSWQTCRWPGPLRRQVEDYHILDFEGWHDPARFAEQASKLLEGLRHFYRLRLDA
jgi:hypothetical protein